jgi:hypothetical protein
VNEERNQQRWRGSTSCDVSDDDKRLFDIFQSVSGKKKIVGQKSSPSRIGGDWATKTAI